MLIIRLANFEDAMDVLRWRNDDQTRAMSWKTDCIDPLNHAAWFSAAVNDRKRILLIGEIKEKKIGLVRFDAVEEDVHTWLINIMIAPESRSQGFGGRLLAHAISFFSSKIPEASLVAEVKVANNASKHLFEKLGFFKTKNDGEKLEYKRPNFRY